MIRRPKLEPRSNEFLRAVSFGTAILVFLHVAAFPTYLGFASLMFFGMPYDYKILGYVLLFTGLMSLAAFCISTQFYLHSKQREQSNKDS